MKKNKEEIIKALLAELYDSQQVELATTEVLEDGTTIYINKLEVGGEVTTLDSEGVKSPLFDGEHKLKDGSTIVSVAGKITEIKPKAEEVAAEVTPVEAAVAPEVAIVPEVPVAIDEAAVLAIIQPKLDELYKVIADIKTLIEADNAEDVAEDVPVLINGQESLASFFVANRD